MSANMFPQHHSTPLSEMPPKPPTGMPNSKIPIPSPRPLRRSFSMRMKGEKVSFPVSSFNDSTRKPPDAGRFSTIGKIKDNTAQSSSDNRPTEGTQLLPRRHSFMASGERGDENNGGGGGEKYSKRPDHVKIATAGGGRMPRSPVEGGTTNIRGGGYVTTPDTPSRVRSLSLSLSNAKVQANSRSPTSVVTSSPNYISKNYSTTNLDRWDTDSITSIGSSVASCDHASVARNGTTFSGRSMKYVFHCNQHAGATGEDYLTPTQRAQRQVKKLKYLLLQARKDLEDKDSDILKLTREVVELRLFKAALSSPEDKSNSSDAITVRENTSDETTPEDLVDKVLTNHHATHEYSSSCADSGHFEDCTSSSVHSKDSVLLDDQRSPSRRFVETSNKSTSANFGPVDHDEEQNRIVLEYEKRLVELIKTHEDESYQLKQKHNDKIEELLQRITEINTRYWQLVPELESARERIKDLEQRLEEASKNMEEQEAKSRETYKKMYEQGKEAAKMEQENVAVELVHQNPSRISVPELLKELQVTKNELDNIRDLEYASTSNNSQPLLSAKEALSLWVLGARKAMYRQLTEAKSKNKIDPEITLQFLKSAVYYFLTDKENSQGHLKAIQSILGFSSNEISNIDKAWFT